MKTIRNRWPLQYQSTTLSYWQHIINIIKHARNDEHQERMNTENIRNGSVIDHAKAEEAKLAREISCSHEVLVTAKAKFPFSMFPDVVTLDRVKLTVTHHTFIRSSDVASIQIEDILNTAASVGPFFGSIKLWTRFYSEDPFIINNLSRQDATHIKQLLQGYVIARQKGVDCSSIPKEELVDMLSKLGSDS